MTALAGPFHLFALVLVVSGIGKVVDPVPPADAMAAAGLPVPLPRRAMSGRVLGAVEVVTGLLALAVPVRGAAVALAVFYVALAAFVVRLRRADATAGCGCFGAASAPPGPAHVVANLVGAAIATTVAVTGVPDLMSITDDGLATAAAYVALLAIGAGLVLLGPALLASLHQVRHEPRRFGSVR